MQVLQLTFHYKHIHMNFDTSIFILATELKIGMPENIMVTFRKHGSFFI